MNRTAPLVLLSTLAVMSCTAFGPKDVANPSTLNVKDAMRDIGEGFNNLHDALNKGNVHLGMFPCTVSVSLNVTASAKEGGELVVDTSIKPPATVVDASVSGKLTQTNTSEGTRGNTINIALVSPACIPKDTLGFDKPDKVGAVGTAIIQLTTPGGPPLLPFAPLAK